MALNNKLKKQIDLPVWEWMRFAPTVTSSVSTMTTTEDGENRYIYYLVGTLFYRYDTFADTWQQLASPNITPTLAVSMRLTMNRGFHGRVISSTSSTVTIPGLRGPVFNGKNIKILQGTGVGQERTLTYVSETVHDFGVATAATTTNLTDSLKKWKINQWAGYMVGITFGANTTQYKKILYNDTTTLYISDANLQPHDPWNNQAFQVNAPYTTLQTTGGTQSHYQIFSSTYSLDSNWTVNPDTSSFFTTITGGIYLLSSINAVPYISLQYYDIAHDQWQTKTVPQGLILATLGTDISIERTGKFGTAFLTGTATSGSSRTLVDNTKSLVPNRYRNYRILITGGTGIGQNRRILCNMSDTFTVSRPWDIVPDNTSTYEIWGDFDKLYIAGNGSSAMYAYSPENDYWIQGHAFDDGLVNNMAVKLNGWIPFGINSGTRLAAGVTEVASAPTAGGTNYSLGDVLTCSVGGAGAQVRVTGISTGGVVTSVELVNSGTATGFTTGTGKATTGGTGTGCTINITSVGVVVKVTTATNHFLETGDSVTVSGCSEAAYNTTSNILCVNSIASFDIVTTATANMAATVSQSTTVIVDSTKNWTVNEHAGRVVDLVVAGTGPNSQKRWIISNTATTLTVAAIAAGVNGTSKYVIYDAKCFGADTQYKQLDKARDGFATGGSSTTLVDSTKNWFMNQWAGYKMKIEGGTGFGSGIITIVSNTATTLTYTTQSFTPDATTCYEIADTWGLMTAGSTGTMVETGTKNWIVNQWGGKRVKVVAGSNHGQETTVQTNTANTLTTSAITAPDTTSVYCIFGIPVRSTGIQLLWLWGISDSVTKGKYILCPRGGGSNTADMYDITTGQWIYGYFFTPQQETFNTGSMYAYDGHDTIYMHKDATGRVYSYNVVTGEIASLGTIPYGHGSAIIGNRMEIIETADGLRYLYVMRHTGQEMWRVLIFF